MFIGHIIFETIEVSETIVKKTKELYWELISIPEGIRENKLKKKKMMDYKNELNRNYLYNQLKKEQLMNEFNRLKKEQKENPDKYWDTHWESLYNELRKEMEKINEKE